MNTNEHKDFAIFKDSLKYELIKNSNQTGVDDKTIAFIKNDGTIRTHSATFGGRTQYVAGHGISIQGDTLSVDESQLNPGQSNFNLSDHTKYQSNGENYKVDITDNGLLFVNVPNRQYQTTGQNYTEVAFYSSTTINVPTPPNGVTVQIDAQLDRWCRYAYDTDSRIKAIYMSTRTYIAENSSFTSWCPAIQISGSNGNSGADGKNGINGDYNEYIYLLNNDQNGVTTAISYTPNNGKTKDDDDFVPSGWSDNPHGVSLTNKYEWMAWRRKEHSESNPNGTWGPFNDPILWSAYGKLGTDGDGVEYIYYANAEGIAPATNLPSTWTNDANFQEREYIRNGSGWTDDPSYTGIDDMPQGAKVWVSVRKKYADAGTVESEGAYWHAYSAPSLWTYKAKDGSAAQEGVSVTGSLDKTELQIPIKKDTGYNYKFNNSVTLTAYVNASASPIYGLQINSIVDTELQSYDNPSWLTVNGNFISFNIPEDTLQFTDGKQITVTFTGYTTAKGNETPITKSVVLIGTIYDPTGQTPMTPSNKVITEAQHDTMKAQYDNWKETGTGENPFVENCMYTVVDNTQTDKVRFWVMYTNGSLIYSYPPQPAVIPEPKTVEKTEEEYNALKAAGLSFTEEDGKLNYYTTYIIKRNGNIIGYGIAGAEVLLPNEVPVEEFKAERVLSSVWNERLSGTGNPINSDTYYYVYDIIDGTEVVLGLYKGTSLIGKFADPSTLVNESELTSIWKQKIQLAIDHNEDGNMTEEDEETLRAVSTTFAGFQVTDDYDTWMGVIRNAVREGLIDSATFTATIDEVTGQIAAGQKAHKDLKSLVGLKNKSIDAAVNTVIERNYAETYNAIPQDRREGGYYAPALDKIDDDDYETRYITRENYISSNINENTLYLITENGKEGEIILDALYSPKQGEGDVYTLGFYYYTSAINLSAELIDVIANKVSLETELNLDGINSNITALSDRISGIVSAPNKVTQLNIENGVITLQSLTYDSQNGWQEDGGSANITEMVGLAIDGNESKITAIANDFLISGNAKINGDMIAGSISIGEDENGNPVFSVDKNGNMTATSGNFTGQISSSTISGGSIDIGDGKFHVDADGNMIAASATITGSTISDTTILHKLMRGMPLQDASIDTFYGYSGNGTVTADNIRLGGDTLIVYGPYSNDCRIALPPAKFFPGASIKIVNGTYSVDENRKRIHEPSILFLEVIHDSATEAAVEDAYNEELNSIGIAAPVKHNDAILPFDYRSNVTLDPYTTVELISSPNWYHQENSPYYVWMIVDAR